MIDRFFKKVASRRAVGLFCALLTGVIIFSLSFLSASKVQAAKAKKAEEPKKTEDPKKKKTYAEMTDAEKKKLLDEAKEALNNTSWDITLKMSDNEKAPEENDKLIFINNTVVSDKMKAEGFGASNYTIRLKGQMGEIVIWETMQTSEKNGIAFWRGEVRGDGLRGVLSWHVNDTKKVDYALSSKGKSTAPPVVEAPMVETPIVEAPAVETQPAAVEEIKPVTTEPVPAGTDVIKEIEEIPAAPVIKEEPKVKAPEPVPAPQQEKKKGWWGR